MHDPSDDRISSRPHGHRRLREGQLGLSMACLISLLLASGCSLLLDFSDNETQPKDAGADSSNVFLPSSCADDDGTLADPLTPDFSAGQVPKSSICANETADFYGFTPPGNQPVTIQVTYNGTGDVGAKIHEPSAATPIIREAQGTGGTLDITDLGSLEAKPHIIELHIVDSGEVDYELTVKFGP